MLKYKLRDFTRGWVTGNFEPSLVKDNYEVGIKRYQEGDIEPRHYHKLCNEITIVLDGVIEMNGVKYYEGDIIVVSPEESVEFRAFTDSRTCVIKTNSNVKDKYVE